MKRDTLPNGHRVIEQADLQDGRVSQTIATVLGEEYERIVHPEEAYADGEDRAAANSFQDRVQPWMLACFGEEISRDRLERGDRLLEEALELLQSGDYPPERVAALTGYVFGRPKGEPVQEAGGVMVTLAAYCLAHDLDMHVAGEMELERIWTKVEKIRAKQAKKPVGSALPVAVSISPPVLQAYRLGQEHMRDRAARTNIDRTGREWVRESLWDRIAADLSAKIESLAIEDLAP
jgi:hypothetical protein